ncbi:hypothetical protein D9615_001575 [Tricholomella constricta]|uniref:Cupredoxin n=1 Tax=Tricholomella constricta TaxID=117010 RepID=A0A8H5HPS9_9AGAR|nr:hypothetical protein D9615_001575 [Tricholomella constricta]
MRYLAATVVALTSVAVASAANIQVLVGDNAGLTFTPPSVVAASGDTINFEFRAKNHASPELTSRLHLTIFNTSRVLSLVPGVDSGFQAVAPGATQFPSWSITIDDPSTPLWFFCAQTAPVSHCKAGMVFAINPTAEKSFDAFQVNAKSGPSGSAPPASGDSEPAPGVPGNSGGSGGSGGSDASSSSSSTTAIATGTLSGFSTVVGTPPASTGAAGNSTNAPLGNGALRLGGSTSALLALAGLLAGLIL